jgi:5'-nucleotidase
MFAKPIDLAKARILISNDDGIHAPGLKLLESVVRALCPDVWVVAPADEQSGVSHSLTLRRPLRIDHIEPKRYAVDGTPTDCVLLAIKHIMREEPPDLVLSGINGGGNLGEDITYSGTVAAAMEATLLGVPAIALSQHYDRTNGIDWSPAEAWCGRVIERLTATPWPKNTLINVNFPDGPADKVSGIVAVRQGFRKVSDNLTERIDPRGRPYYWVGPMRDRSPAEPGTDIEAAARGCVTVTPVNLDMTSAPALKELKKVFP